VKKKLSISIFLICSFVLSFNNFSISIDDIGMEGPPPAGNYKLGYKELKRAIKVEKKNKIKKAKIKYEKALGFLLEANAENPGNPDILNYLGFTSTKLGYYENAEIYYRLGLELSPNYNDINRNLGELYLITNRKDEALERLTLLKKCNCNEYNELKKLIETK